MVFENDRQICCAVVTHLREVPIFVSSDMSLPVQAADLVIYSINWGYRNADLTAPAREEVSREFALRIDELQYRGQGYRDGRVFNQWGICFVPNPYGKGR